VVAPQCRRTSSKTDERGVWLPEDLELFLQHLKATHAEIDAERVYLTGNSMGGYGCWVWGGHHPEHFAAIAPIVGGIGRKGPKDVTPDLDQWAANLAKVPVYAFVGAKDRVVPAERSVRMIDAIRKAGGRRAKIKIYAEEGHGASKAVFSSAAYFDWMFSQKRSTRSD
jgi:predicted peptidase